MTTESSDLSLLVKEYEVLAQEVENDVGRDEVDWSSIERLLINDSEWTHRGAAELIGLVRDYGSFILRNAAALALALEIEDGEKRL